MPAKSKSKLEDLEHCDWKHWTVPYCMLSFLTRYEPRGYYYIVRGARSPIARFWLILVSWDSVPFSSPNAVLLAQELHQRSGEGLLMPPGLDRLLPSPHLLGDLVYSHGKPEVLNPYCGAI